MHCVYVDQNFHYAFPELAAWYSLKIWDFKLQLRTAVIVSLEVSHGV